jgi:hypothetical protein
MVNAQFSVVEREIITLLRCVPRATWGMLGLYECLALLATREQIDVSLADLRRAGLIDRDQLGIWSPSR